MATNKLIPYWVRVRKVEEPDKTWDQTNLQEHEPKFPENNLADYFHSFLEQYKGDKDVETDEEREKTFTVAPPIRRDGHTIEGRFKSGEWGRNADFWDINEHERLEEARKENHAEEVPYYFLFHIPDQDPYQALLILSKYKRKGVKTLFEDLFLPQDRSLDVGDAYMDINPHYSDEAVQKLEEADSIRSVKFRGRDRVGAREEYADRNDIERATDEISGQLDVGVELKLTPKENQYAFLQFVKGLIPGEDRHGFDYGRVADGDYSSANATVMEGESQLTFSLWKEQIQMRMDVDPDDYDLDIYGGYPTPYSIGCVARQLANDLMRDYNTGLPTESLIPRQVGVPEESTSLPTAED